MDFGSGSSFSQYFYPPFDLNYNLGNALALASPGLRVPLPGGGQAIVGATGVNNYRHPNWQGSQVLQSTPTRTVAADNAFSPYGEH